ncbi:MAG: hypothetical protein JW991_02125 [Candidatus Pacebacteria bacterium]|nr:hypothetical protein [Candidatus Paceibacterota bacterium]
MNFFKKTNRKLVVIIFSLCFLLIGLAYCFLYARFWKDASLEIPCANHLDCLLRISPGKILKGYRSQCVHQNCVFIFPEPYQPVGH